jgi:hypothetical protein
MMHIGSWLFNDAVSTALVVRNRIFELVISKCLTVAIFLILNMQKLFLTVVLDAFYCTHSRFYVPKR